MSAQRRTPSRTKGKQSSKQNKTGTNVPHISEGDDDLFVLASAGIHCRAAASNSSFVRHQNTLQHARGVIHLLTHLPHAKPPEARVVVPKHPQGKADAWWASKRECARVRPHRLSSHRHRRCILCSCQGRSRRSVVATRTHLTGRNRHGRCGRGVNGSSTGRSTGRCGRSSGRNSSRMLGCM